MRDDNHIDFKKAYKYIEDTFHPEDDSLKKIRHAMAEEQKEGMSISAVEAGFLQLLIKSQGIKTIVEIGCFLGYSAVQMARALPESGKLYTCESNENYATKAKAFIRENKMESRVEVLVGPAEESLRKISHHAPFDLIFIDADKGAYLNYLDWYENNTKSGSWIIGDNTFLFGSVFEDKKPLNESQKRYEIMRAFNQRLTDKSKYISTCLPTLEGMTIAKKL